MRKNSTINALFDDFIGPLQFWARKNKRDYCSLIIRTFSITIFRPSIVPTVCQLDLKAICFSELAKTMDIHFEFVEFRLTVIAFKRLPCLHVTFYLLMSIATVVTTDYDYRWRNCHTLFDVCYSTCYKLQTNGSSYSRIKVWKCRRTKGTKKIILISSISTCSNFGRVVSTHFFLTKFIFYSMG